MTQNEQKFMPGQHRSCKHLAQRRDGAVVMRQFDQDGYMVVERLATVQERNTLTMAYGLCQTHLESDLKGAER